MRKNVSAEILPLLATVSEELDVLPAWTASAIHAVISGAAERAGLALGKLAQPLRLAMCGGTVSPPIDATLAILGKQAALQRLAAARSLWGAATT